MYLIKSKINLLFIYDFIFHFKVLNLVILYFLLSFYFQLDNLFMAYNFENINFLYHHLIKHLSNFNCFLKESF